MTKFLSIAASAALTAAALFVPATAAHESIACPALVAHQGYSGAANGDGPIPSNSVASLRNAVSHGARIVEFDVRWSRDGIPVVIHNSTVNMTTAHQGLVADYKASTLERMRLVDPWNTDHQTDDTIPSLAEMVAAAKAENVLAIVEIKVDNITSAEAASFTAAVGSYSAVSVQSFYATSLAMLPQYRRTLLTETAVTDAPGDVGIDMRASIVTASLVSELHAAGLVAGAYTTPGSGVADDAAEWAKLADDGVNRIITNDTAGYVAWVKDDC